MRSGGLLPVLSACRSLSCPMIGRYGSGSSVPLPPVGSVERSQLEDYVNRCFDNMAITVQQPLAGMA